MPKEEICVVCNKEYPPKRKGKNSKKQSDSDTVGWICCDGCLGWCHIACVRINEQVAKESAKYWYYCEKCTIRGSLILKHDTSVLSLSSTVDLDLLNKQILDLTSSIQQLQKDLLALRSYSKKQIDHLQNCIKNADRAEVKHANQIKLVEELEKKLEVIESGAKLASTCSQNANSCRIALNKIPLREGENVRQLVEHFLQFLEIPNLRANVLNCFRLPAKPSKWTDRTLTPTIIVIFDSKESKDKVLRRYFEKHRQAKLCNLKSGLPLEYRFTANEVLSIDAFRIRNLALRLKHRGVLKSVYVRNNKVSVQISGQKQYHRVEDTNHLVRLTDSLSDSNNSSAFFDAADESFSSPQ